MRLACLDDSHDDTKLGVVYGVGAVDLIKTSSFPNGFVVKQSGRAQLATTIKDNRTQQLTAVVQFMTKRKLHPLPNSVTVKSVFGQNIANKV
jgi:hypothetical protein